MAYSGTYGVSDIPTAIFDFVASFIVYMTPYADEIAAVTVVSILLGLVVGLLTGVIRIPGKIKSSSKL